MTSSTVNLDYVKLYSTFLNEYLALEHKSILTNTIFLILAFIVSVALIVSRQLFQLMPSMIASTVIWSILMIYCFFWWFANRASRHARQSTLDEMVSLESTLPVQPISVVKKMGVLGGRITTGTFHLAIMVFVIVFSFLCFGS